VEREIILISVRGFLWRLRQKEILARMLSAHVAERESGILGFFGVAENPRQLTIDHRPSNMICDGRL
jgi:hypothetical protein